MNTIIVKTIGKLLPPPPPPRSNTNTNTNTNHNHNHKTSVKKVFLTLCAGTSMLVSCLQMMRMNHIMSIRKALILPSNNNTITTIHKTNHHTMMYTITQNSHTNNNQQQKQKQKHDDRRDRWEPSEEWIQDCIDSQQTTSITEDSSSSSSSKQQQPYRVQWPSYQLGDCMRLCRHCSTSMIAAASGGDEFIGSNWSIAGQYWEHVCHRQEFSKSDSSSVPELNVTFLKELFETINRQQDSAWPRPADDELVIHLRLGDVMDEKGYVGKNTTVFEMLYTGVDTRHGKKSIYRKGIRSLREYLDIIHKSGLRKVVLRGGPHFAKPYPKSRIYSTCLAKAIETAGYNLTSAQIQGENNPDQDFYYMSHANQFVLATGGYSAMISQLVERVSGGVIVGRRFYNNNNNNNNKNHIDDNTGGTSE